MSDEVCPVHNPTETWQAGQKACFRCSNRILRQLRELEEYLPTLSLLKTVSGGEGRKPGFGSSSPANDAAIHHTDWRTTPTALDGMGAVATIHEWATMLREDRGIAPPERMSVFAELHALRHNHAWIICQSWVADYATEVREIHAAVREAASDPIPRAVGKCIAVRPHGECGGDVFETPDASGARCSDWACRRLYTGLDLVRLGVAQEAG